MNSLNFADKQNYLGVNTSLNRFEQSILLLSRTNYQNWLMQFNDTRVSTTTWDICSDPFSVFSNNYQSSFPIIMNEYSQSPYHYEEDSLFLQQLHPCIYGQQFKQSESPLSKQKNPTIETNYIEIDPPNHIQKRRAYNSIDVNHERRYRYITIFKGNTTETMQLHHTFKTILSNLLKDLIILKILDKAEIKRCRAFFQSVPSFQSIFTLFATPNQNSVLRAEVARYFRSKNIIQKIMQSKVRMDQKKTMIKYIERLRVSIQYPTQKRKWKKM